MNTKNKITMTIILTSLLSLYGCGGNNGSSSNNSPTSNAASFKVAGPLDPAQAALQNTLAQVSSSSPQPVSSVAQCSDVIVAQNLLDIGDVVINTATGTGTPQEKYNSALMQVNNALLSVTTNLALTIENLQATSQGKTPQTCTASNFTPTSNLINSIPIINQLYAQLDNQKASPNLSTLTYVTQKLSDILSQGLSTVPSQAQSVPVLGGILGTLQDLNSNLNPALNNVFSYSSSGNPAIEKLLSDLLVDGLTKVVPIDKISPTDAQKVADTSKQLANDLGHITGPLLTAVNLLATSGLSSVLSPVIQLINSLLLPPS